MVRPKKVVAVGRAKEEESPDSALMVQSRSRRTIKPNPKYNSKEIIPMKRIAGDDDDDDDDEEHDANQSAEDDEDFRDDGARDSDPDETMRSRKRGRPRTAVVPRSEPPPQRRLQQIRAGLKEVTMSASKIMQQSGLGGLDKKRKIDYDDGEVDEPSAKRKSTSVATPVSTRVGTRLAAASATTPKTPVATTGKENATAGLKKKEEVKIVSMQNILNRSTGTAAAAVTPARKASPVGITTRRQQATTTITASAATPSPKTTTITTAAGIVRSQVVLGSAAKEAPNRSMIQVRRATPMANSQTSPAAAVTVTAVKPTTPTTLIRQKTPASKERVILNRTPVVKPKPAAPATAIAPSPATPSPRTFATRAQATVIGKSSPVALAKVAVPVNRILNALPPQPAIQPVSVTTVPADAELEPYPGDATKARMTTLEKRFVLQMEECQDEAQDDSPSINLLQLRSEIKSLKMPTEHWSYQMKLHAHRGQRDPDLEVPDKPGYKVYSVILNRVVPATSPPKLLNGQKVNQKQFDRSVELLKNQYNVSIDGRSVKLMGAPSRVADKEDVETLLEIVNEVTINNPVVKATAAATVV